MQAAGVERLILESRQDDREDVRIIERTRRAERLLVFEHRIARVKPMLGVADGITRAAGAGTGWFALIEPLAPKAIELRP